MATSIAGGRPILLSQLRSALLQRTITPLASLTSVRYKQQSVRRPKAPHVAKETAKWTKSNKKAGKEVTKAKSEQESPNWINRKPVDNVWIRAVYPRQSFSFEKCIQRHREYADPSMLDNMEGLVYADMELNMTTKKKTKFMRNISATLLLPHMFNDGVEKKCAVFCKSAEDQQKAKDLGALFVGSADLIRQILDDEIKRDEYDFALCTPDILVDLVPIRSILKDKFPHKGKGNLNSNIEEMMELHTKGITYTSNKETDAVGRLQVPLGTLNMSTDELQDNFLTIIQSVSKQKAPELGKFISQVMIIAPPSSERFQLQIQDYVTQHEKKPVKAEEEEDDEDEDEETQLRS